MESVQLALKTSFHLQPPERITPYPSKLDSITTLDLVNENSHKAEEFSIDDLLDFSNDELFQLQDDEEHHTEEEAPQAKQQKTVPSPQSYATVTKNSCVTDDFSSITFPAEDLENLEWLSQFVEDSFCGYSSTNLAPNSPPSVKAEQRRAVQGKDVLVTPVQTKARSKRARSGLHVWPGKKLKEKSGSQQQPRRCSHCGVQKTPQWRAGPLGSKTLCNACGVRFKSGRLLPEYRPACSPTFSYELHSNSHRKVMEMRRKKWGGDTGSEFVEKLEV